MLVFYLAALDSDDNKNKFETIYRKYYRFMLHTAAGIIKNPTLAEDAVHETFVQLLREIDTLRIDNERALKSYLYRVGGRAAHRQAGALQVACGDLQHAVAGTVVDGPLSRRKWR